MLNAGGDIAVGCRRTDTADWLLGIEDPADRTRLVATVPLRVGGIATSGTAARGAHIVVPAHRAAGHRACARSRVIGPSLMWADVYATAAFARGPAGADWLAGLDDHLAFVVPRRTVPTVTVVSGVAPATPAQERGHLSDRHPGPGATPARETRPVPSAVSGNSQTAGAHWWRGREDP